VVGRGGSVLLFDVNDVAFALAVGERPFQLVGHLPKTGLSPSSLIPLFFDLCLQVASPKIRVRTPQLTKGGKTSA
jgi:hypothetical protein